ncbi:MAG: hypothetical protein LBO67_07285 [Spirochaetaceae bacterium]|nr:hypothetical protein [Spirochaetaceae bacterium]
MNSAMEQWLADRTPQCYITTVDLTVTRRWREACGYLNFRLPAHTGHETSVRKQAINFELVLKKIVR